MQISMISPLKAVCLKKKKKEEHPKEHPFSFVEVDSLSIVAQHWKKVLT